MISTNIKFFLLAQYVIITIATLCEKNYGEALYWLGACILLTGVLVMGGK